MARFSVCRIERRMSTMRKVLIYGLFDKTGLRYVGKAVNLKRRLKSHLHAAKSGVTTHTARWIQSLFQQGDRPRMEVLEEADEQHWEQRERYWIAFYRKAGSCLTNLTDGGGGGLGHKVTDSQRRRMSEKMRGRPRPPEYRQRIAQGMKAYFNSLSANEREKFAESRRGHYPSKETRQKLSKSQLKRFSDPEARRRLGEAHRGLKRSDETRRKQSIAALGHTLCVEGRQKIAEANRRRKWSAKNIARREATRQRQLETLPEKRKKNLLAVRRYREKLRQK